MSGLGWQRRGLRGCLGAIAACGIALLAAAGVPDRAEANILGSCALYDFGAKDGVGSIDESGFIQRNAPVPVIREGAVLRDGPSERAAALGRLDFAQRVGIHRRVGTYVEIKSDPRDAATIGWVDGDDLLCRAQPLVSTTTGLEQKFYIKTRASFQDDEVVPVKASPSVDIVDCDTANRRCRELSRFALHYVHAVDFQKGRLLLLSEFQADVTAPIIGWVSAQDGYLWETRLGLRPRTDLVLTDEDAVAGAQPGEERPICVYETPEAAFRQEACTFPLLGGERWFGYPIRMPVIDRVDGEKSLFSVVLPVPGVGDQASADIIDQIEGLENALGALQQLRKIDVFFLIDGTQSMQPHIDAIVGRGGTGVLGAIRDAFTEDRRFAGTQVRFGFRVYRDIYAGDNGIGEGMPLGQVCDLSPDELDEEYIRFDRAVRAITTEVPAVTKDPDHEENLFFGLYQAVDDMSTCDEHVKMLFVIGDTGYDAESQIAQGGIGISQEDVADFLTLNFDETVDPVIPFFIQVPEAGESLSYKAAYAKFTPQAEAITQRVLDHMGRGTRAATETTLEDHVVSLRGRSLSEAKGDLVQQILDTVSRFGDQAPINEIIAELKGGEALVNVITQLQRADEFNNVPGLRLSQIERRLCDELGPACRERVYNVIAQGFIVDDEDVVTDVWMEHDEFSQWRKMLEGFRNTSNTEPDKLAGLIVRQMTRVLQGQIGDLTVEDVNRSVAEYLNRRHGLPVGEFSPLLKYTLSDLMTTREGALSGGEGGDGLIGVCELNLLGNWLERHREIFDSVFVGEIPVFELDRQSACANVRHETPMVRFKGYQSFSKPGLDFKYVIGDRTIYWVPSEYLP